eukprot:CAMPEP_0197000324 /NCGR_PEP_ID=MMETSP1380-20130617/5301_1 /TAXON_ID=5936 /ORGANISM="Euplotes crassus, Strain CT5" /LENGTH=199 /DNA_ID=CAMNT_0042417595 /DNA_START=355 /DNA_END=954 /DNA_ORIENTATION=-
MQNKRPIKSNQLKLEEQFDILRSTLDRLSQNITKKKVDAKACIDLTQQLSVGIDDLEAACLKKSILVSASEEKKDQSMNYEVKEDDLFTTTRNRVQTITDFEGRGMEEEKKQRNNSGSSPMTNKPDDLMTNDRNGYTQLKKKKSVHFEEFKGYDVTTESKPRKEYSQNDSDCDSDGLEFYDAVDHIIYEELEKTMREEK